MKAGLRVGLRVLGLGIIGEADGGGVVDGGGVAFVGCGVGVAMQRVLDAKIGNVNVLTLLRSTWITLAIVSVSEFPRARGAPGRQTSGCLGSWSGD
jgi:hypothetical protein